MIRVRATIRDDLPRIGEWIEADADHRGKMDAEWWLKGFASCALDGTGPVMFLRIDREGDQARVHIQFAPEHEVSKFRIASAFLDGIPRMERALAKQGYKAMIFDSVTSSLIRFMGRIGFVSLGDRNFVRTF